MSNFIPPIIAAVIGFLVGVIIISDDSAMILGPMAGIAVWWAYTKMFPQLGNFLLKRDAVRRGDYEPRE